MENYASDDYHSHGQIFWCYHQTHRRKIQKWKITPRMTIILTGKIFVAIIKPIGTKFKKWKITPRMTINLMRKIQNWEMRLSLNQSTYHWRKIQNWTITPQWNNIFVR